MKKYKSYLKEKYGRILKESNNGFIDYAIYDDNSMYIYTLFVTEENRDKGEAELLVSEVVKQHKPTIIFCDIDKDSNEWLKSLIQICGKPRFKLYEELEDKIVLYKRMSYE